MEEKNINMRILLLLKHFRAFAVLVFLILFSVVGAVEATTPAFNNMSNDLKTLTLENRTTNPAAVNAGSANWRDPISASGGDAISFRFYYHNTVDGTVANNTKLMIGFPTTASSTIVTTGTIVSDNASQVTDTATINVSSSQTLAFDSTAIWYPNQTTSGGTSLPVTITGGEVEVNIGNIAGGWPAQGNVVFRATISNSGGGGGGGTNNQPPVVNAGSNKDIQQGTTAVLNATATDPQGQALTYSWTCTGGTLSSSTVLNPTYSAPITVSASTNYTCTITATDVANLSASSSVTITIEPATSSGGGGGGGNSSSNSSSNNSSLGGGGGGIQTLSVSLSANPNSGSAPLNNINLTANVTRAGLYDYPITYSFDCTNDGTYEFTTAQANNFDYTALNVCSYPQPGTYIAKVKVDSAFLTAYDQVQIIVAGSGGSAGGLSVTTNSPSDIDQYSADLNGIISGNSGQARFDWGENTSYGNLTNLINENQGDSFSADISGLQKGKAYHYRAEALSNGSSVYGQDVSFVTLADAPTNLSANSIKSNQIGLSWTNGDASCNTVIVRKMYGYPISVDDGLSIYYGPGNSLVDTNLDPNTIYYYKAWAVACDQGLHSFSTSPASQIRVATLPGVSSAASNAVASNMVVDVLAKNLTKNTALADSVSVSPGDEIEIDVIVTPAGPSGLSNVTIKNTLPSKLSYEGLSGGASVGNIAFGDSKIISFRVKVGPSGDFDYGSSGLTNTTEVSADNIPSVNKDLTINVTKSVETSAALVDLLGSNFLVYAAISVGTFLLMLGFICYLLIERRKSREYQKQNREEVVAPEPKPRKTKIIKGDGSPG